MHSRRTPAEPSPAHLPVAAEAAEAEDGAEAEEPKKKHKKKHKKDKEREVSSQGPQNAIILIIAWRPSVARVSRPGPPALARVFPSRRVPEAPGLRRVYQGCTG